MTDTRIVTASKTDLLKAEERINKLLEVGYRLVDTQMHSDAHKTPRGLSSVIMTYTFDRGTLDK